MNKEIKRANCGSGQLPPPPPLGPMTCIEYRGNIFGKEGQHYTDVFTDLLKCFIDEFGADKIVNICASTDEWPLVLSRAELEMIESAGGRKEFLEISNVVYLRPLELGGMTNRLIKLVKELGISDQIKIYHAGSIKTRREWRVYYQG